MKLSALDIRKQDFKRGLRGFDVEEVQAYLELVANQWTSMREELDRSQATITELEGKLSHYTQVEEALQEALRTARETAKAKAEQSDAALQAARVDAERIVSDANQEADTLLERAREQVRLVRRRRIQAVSRLKSLLESELTLLAEFEQENPLPKRAAQPTAEPSTEASAAPAAASSASEPSAPEASGRADDIDALLEDLD